MGFFSSIGQRAGMAWALHPARQLSHQQARRPFPELPRAIRQYYSPGPYPRMGKQICNTGKDERLSLNADTLSLLSHDPKDPNLCVFRVGEELGPRFFISSLV